MDHSARETAVRPLRSGAPVASGPPSARLSRVPRDEPTVNRDQVSIDDMLAWVARHGFSKDAVGYATKRITEPGTLDQVVAFTSAIRAAIRNRS
jgi:hypothetical protein